MEVEDRENLRDGDAQAVMQPTPQHRHAIPDLTLGQCLRHRRFHALAALFAPIAMDRELGHNGVDVFGDVLDDSRPRLTTPRQFALTSRAPIQAQHHRAVNDGRRRATRADMSLLLPRFLAAPRRCRFLVDRLHAGRSRGRFARFRLLVGQEFGQLQQGKHDGFGPLLVNGLSFVGREIRPQRDVESSGNGTGLLA